MVDVQQCVGPLGRALRQAGERIQHLLVQVVELGFRVAAKFKVGQQSHFILHRVGRDHRGLDEAGTGSFDGGCIASRPERSGGVFGHRTLVSPSRSKMPNWPEERPLWVLPEREGMIAAA